MSTRTDIINVGIIGAGRIGRLHAEHLAYRIPEARILAVSDISLPAAEKCASDFNIPDTAQDHRVIMENVDIDAIIICSSTDTHSQMIIDAAEAGKHIFCEKPIDHSLTRIDKALESVDKAGVKLQIGFNRRFDPNLRRAWELIREGKIGKPHILRITSRDPEPPPIEYIKVSGGIFLDMTIHDFDMARFLIESEVYEIYTAAGVMVDPGIGKVGDLDTAIITLKFENGVLGTIDNSRKAVYSYDQRIEVFGSGGMVAVSNVRPNTARLSTSESISEDLPPFFFIERYIDSYIAEMKEFIRCVANDKPPGVTGIDGRMPVVMGKAARLSYDENRPVKLTEIYKMS